MMPGSTDSDWGDAGQPPNIVGARTSISVMCKDGRHGSPLPDTCRPFLGLYPGQYVAEKSGKRQPDSAFPPTFRRGRVVQ
jgi:hypothetical protein